MGRRLFQSIHEGGPGAADGLTLLIHHAPERLFHTTDQSRNARCRINGSFGHPVHGFRYGNPDLVRQHLPGRNACFSQLHHFTGLDFRLCRHLPQGQGDPVNAFCSKAHAGCRIPHRG